MEIRCIVFGSCLCIDTFTHMWITLGVGSTHGSFICGLIRCRTGKIYKVSRGFLKGDILRENIYMEYAARFS